MQFPVHHTNLSSSSQQPPPSQQRPPSQQETTIPPIDRDEVLPTEEHEIYQQLKVSERVENIEKAAKPPKKTLKRRISLSKLHLKNNASHPTPPAILPPDTTSSPHKTASGSVLVKVPQNKENYISQKSSSPSSPKMQLRKSSSHLQIVWNGRGKESVDRYEGNKNEILSISPPSSSSPSSPSSPLSSSPSTPPPIPVTKQLKRRVSLSQLHMKSKNQIGQPKSAPVIQISPILSVSPVSLVSQPRRSASAINLRQPQSEQLPQRAPVIKDGLNKIWGQEDIRQSLLSPLQRHESTRKKDIHPRPSKFSDQRQSSSTKRTASPPRRTSSSHSPTTFSLRETRLSSPRETSSRRPLAQYPWNKRTAPPPPRDLTTLFTKNILSPPNHTQFPTRDPITPFTNNILSPPNHTQFRRYLLFFTQKAPHLSRHVIQF